MSVGSLKTRGSKLEEKKYDECAEFIRGFLYAFVVVIPFWVIVIGIVVYLI